jgi:hypothetical protein
MSKADLAQVWRQRLDACAQSGKSVVDWCYFNQVSVHQYYYWKRRLSDPSPQATAPPQWLPVEVEPAAPLSAAATGVSVRIGGVRIEVNAGFDPATLRAVVVALAGLAC